MFISHLTTVITGLLAVSVPVDGKCFKKPDGNGHVNWPKQKTQILSKMFKSCKTLKTIGIPFEVEFIHDSAFYKSGLDLSELTATWRDRATELLGRLSESNRKAAELEEEVLESREKAAELEETVLERGERILALEARIAALEDSCAETSSPTDSPSGALTVSPTSSNPFACPNGKPFSIALMNMGSNSVYDDAFASAKAKWESIIKCDLQDYQASLVEDWFVGYFEGKSFNGPVDDVVIGYKMDFIDGPGNILGRAGSRYRRASLSPISGIMEFDSDDFDEMSQNDAEIIILHEMGHVLGLVNKGNCYSPCDSGNYDYGWDSNCALASNEYAKLNLGIGALRVEDDGGGGTECSHWEEDSFPKVTGSSELMTGVFEQGFAQPITRVTIAALDEAFDDFVVDYSVADAFPFPQFLAYGEPSNVYYPDTNFTTSGIQSVESMEIPK
eukprot:CAMPEP_0194285316 /NCGR_PEP_ID=MMETSP0169-20130528/29912_1 /TAXON_ID=218684 /ORGANISM="Corethron pennatum, Strain L29A3" /LENGTH=444 /DNA_ID=CAMNT_0039031409 /DNA_START=23 /DNA_END=1357 /DNA_ORIENTATION=+